VSVTNVPEWTA